MKNRFFLMLVITLLIGPTSRLAQACCTGTCEDPVCNILEGSGISAEIKPRPYVYVCRQDVNPCPDCDGEGWWHYFSGEGTPSPSFWLELSDEDIQVTDWWESIDSDLSRADEPCFCKPHHEEWPISDDRFETQWTGTVDLTKPDGYALGCAVTQPPPGGGECPPYSDSAVPLQFHVIVLDVNLTFPGLEDEHETESPGGLLGFNNDDDDDNLVLDYLQQQPSQIPVMHENDLVPITLSGNWSPKYSASASWSISGGPNVRLWKAPDKSEPMEPGPIPWTRYNGFLGTVYVEGIAPGPGAITLTAVDGPGEESRPSCSDIITVTVVNADIQTHLGDMEEDNPGHFINVNWDADWDSSLLNKGWTNNGEPPDATYTPDKDKQQLAQADDDLYRFTVDLYPRLPGSTLVFSASSGVKIWEDQTKSAEGPTEVSVSELPKTLYLEGVLGSSALREVELRAQYRLSDQRIVHTDTARWTVVEVTLSGMFSGNQQSDNQARFSQPPGQMVPASSDKNGIISWNDPDSNCVIFHNCMELQGTIKPSGLPAVCQYGSCFGFAQEIRRRVWTLYWPSDIWQKGPDTWTWDWVAYDTTPSAQDHIYSIAAPGYGDCSFNGSELQFSNCRDYAMFAGAQCSDFFKWHAQLSVTRDESLLPVCYKRSGLQTLGAGWVAPPENP